MTVIHYFALERYRERYTDNLANWTVNRFTELGGEVVRYGDNERYQQGEQTIVGAYGRVMFCTQQVAEFMQAISDGKVQASDVIYLDDMMTPGIEGVFYALHLHGLDKVRILARNFAQSVDQYDFTQPMRPWMQHYERMVSARCDIVVASDQHAELCDIASWPGRIVNYGLPYSMLDTLRMAAQASPNDALQSFLNDRPYMVYSSRWDYEKQPAFLLSVAERLADAGIVTVVCSGSDRLRGDRASIAKAEEMHAAGKLFLMLGCERHEYLATLNGAMVQFNCALQDWVSYTMLEAATLDVPSVVPAFRSFLECADPVHTYKPWCVDDAVRHVEMVLDSDSMVSQHRRLRLAQHHDRALGRIYEHLSSGWQR